MAFSPPTSRRRPPMKALGGGERSSIQKFCPASPLPGKFGMFLQVVPQGDAWERWPWRLCPKPEAGRDWGGGVQDRAQGPGKEISMKRPIVLCCFYSLWCTNCSFLLHCTVQVVLLQSDFCLFLLFPLVWFRFVVGCYCFCSCYGNFFPFRCPLSAHSTLVTLSWKPPSRATSLAGTMQTLTQSGGASTCCWRMCLRIIQ